MVTKQAKTEYARITSKVAVQSFRDYATRWQGASVGLVAACAVCLIICLRSKAKVEYATTVLKLRAEVAEVGIKEAMIYKYVGLGRALAEHVDKIEGDSPSPLGEIMKATAPNKAVEVLVEYIQGQGITSLDGLAVLVGKYKRTPVASEETDEEEADIPQLPGPPVAPTKATAEAIGLRIVKEPEVLNSVPTNDLIGSYLKAGHSACEVVEAAVPYIRTLREAKRALKAVQAKIDQIESRASLRAVV